METYLDISALYEHYMHFHNNLTYAEMSKVLAIGTFSGAVTREKNSFHQAD